MTSPGDPICRTSVEGVACNRRLGHDGEHHPARASQRLYLAPSPASSTYAAITYRARHTATHGLDGGERYG